MAPHDLTRFCANVAARRNAWATLAAAIDPLDIDASRSPIGMDVISWSEDESNILGRPITRGGKGEGRLSSGN
jgi:hypothetical protein